GDVDGLDAAVNLAGVNVGQCRWTEAPKREVLQTRAPPTPGVAAGSLPPGRGARSEGGQARAWRGAESEWRCTGEDAPVLQSRRGREGWLGEGAVQLGRPRGRPPGDPTRAPHH